MLALSHPPLLPSAATTASAPRTTLLSPLTTWPTHTPVNASRDASRRTRMTRGRCGSLPLHRSRLSPPTSCRSPGAPRLNDKQHGAIVIIMQRLHEDDLVGHVLAQEPWEVVCFPAIAEADEVHEIDTILRARTLMRWRGEALHPARAAGDP